MRWTRGAFWAVVLAAAALTYDVHVQAQIVKLDPVLQQRVGLLGTSPVVITAPNSAALSLLAPVIQQAGGTVGRLLPIINSRAATLPNASLALLAASGLVSHVAFDRPMLGSMERTSATIGATAVRQNYGFNGAGVGIAVIDSGVMATHDDLAARSGNPSRVARFVDFVQSSTTPYDDHGHGTHVAGIIAGTGVDTYGARSGIAPGAHLVVLKVLDSSGRGSMSNVIAALDYVASHRSELNIRAVNLSLSGVVTESYESDPLAQATKAVVDLGVVVIASAGNNGRRDGHDRYGAVGSPGNAPWVLTVGASSHQGTVDVNDDVMATFSSRGPTAVDRGAKPDLVAPGVGIESLSSPNSTLYQTRSAYLLNGFLQTFYAPYLSLSGTSQAAPVVAGTVALMFQANPSLTPNAVKAILQFSARVYPQYDALTEGAGFLNAGGAVELARYFAAPASVPYPSTQGWGQTIIWGTHRVGGGRLTPGANAWLSSVRWGQAPAPAQPISWGDICTANCAASPVWESWQTSCPNGDCTSVSWGSGTSANVVWGPSCGGNDCSSTTVWTASSADESVVWGTDDSDSVVWGTSGSESVVWGASSDSVVWGTDCEEECEGVVWPPGEGNEQ
jgi:serine protease AprX